MFLLHRRWPLLIAVHFVIASFATAAEAEVLPETKPLTMTGNLSEQMHAAADREMDKEIAAALGKRGEHWQRDVSSTAAYHHSVRENRARLRKILGLVDEIARPALEQFGDDDNPALVAETERYRVHQVRWRVLDGVTGEGLFLEPRDAPRGYVIALPDADQTPEQLAGLAPGVPLESQFVRRLVESGFAVLAPVMIDRGSEGSGNPAVAMTNQPHREWLHRQAYMMGRTLIGYEVQKVIAAADWMARFGGAAADGIGVAGYGEGGLVALYAAAVEPRFSAALVSGYFKSRERTWREPLYRNVWGLIREFGDVEIASLIAPRALVVEYSAEPKVEGPLPVRTGSKKCAAPGELWTPPLEEVRAEWARLEKAVPQRLQTRALIATHNGAVIPFGSEAALARFIGVLAEGSVLAKAGVPAADRRRTFDPDARQLRQVKEIEAHVQRLVAVSQRTRDDFFLYQAAPEFRAGKWTYAHFPPKPPEPFIAAAQPYRKVFWEEVLGKLDSPLPPLNPRTRKIYDTPKWTGYEVVLDAGGESFAWGVLLLPRDIKAGEKRPVVVCQHGRRGMPADVIEARKEAYHDFAARLAERGFIVLAPHNLYGQEPLYRIISRKGNTVKASMFSLILRHHEQWLRWLATLPHVDPQRIGFYGLSYGGETAVRVPPLLDGYCLSICSGDFNDWTRKVASTEDRHSFMFTEEWEMPYFNMGNTFSYAELTWLMFPRPFMVERGHHDGVAPDTWVASEYARTRWLYAQYGMADRTAIEFFNGGHTINGQGTFEFLHKHLAWPRRE